MAGSHEVDKRVLLAPAGGGFSGGSIACGCGWRAEVGPFESARVVNAALGAEWADHVAEVDDT